MDGFTLTVCQRKGGVGRSTLLYNLAGALAKRGLRTLIVDLDPQASITQICLSPEATDTLPAARTVAGLLGEDFFGSVRDIIVPTGIPEVALVPGSNALARLNHPEPEKTGELQDALRDALADVRGSYDAILCDTPPSLETLSWLPAVAADVALTPTPAEPLAVQELTHAARFLERVRWARNPRLVWIGVVLTMVQKLAIHEAFAASLRETYGSLVFDSPVPFNVAFKECILARQPLAYWKPKGAPARAIDALAGEILARGREGAWRRTGGRMSKAKDLRERFGANIAQTVGMRPAPPPAAPEAGPPDRYAGAVKARSFAEMPVDAILADAQPRTEFDPAELARLADSIGRFGQLAPIRVRHDAGRGRWVVLVGERRLRACKLAGLERVRVEFVERPMTEADVLAEQVVENAVRADLLPVEQGRAYRRLMEMNGWTAQELAGSLGVEPTAVYRASSCSACPTTWRPASTPARSGRRPATRSPSCKLQTTSGRWPRRSSPRGSTTRRRSPRWAAGAGSPGRRAGGREGAPGVGPRLPHPGRKVTVELRKGAGDGAMVAALEDALGQLRARQAGDGQAA
jgi:chromosome partitioning protein